MNNFVDALRSLTLRSCNGFYFAWIWLVAARGGVGSARNNMIQDPQDVQASESRFSSCLAPRTAILDMFTRQDNGEGRVTGVNSTGVVRKC